MNVLTKENREKLYAFVGKAVITNTFFPPIGLGRQPVTIQELLNDYSITTLSNYIDFLEKQASTVSREMRVKGQSEKMINSNISYKEAVEIFDILLNKKIVEKELSKKTSKLRDLEVKRQMCMTDEEKRKILDEEITSLKLELISEEV